MQSHDASHDVRSQVWNTVEETRIMILKAWCYDLKLKGLSNKATFALSNTRELDRVPKYNLSIVIN